MENCSLCKSIKEEKYRIIMENEHAVAILLNGPQLEGHSQIMPKRHVLEIDELNPEEVYAFSQLLQKTRRRIDEVFNCSSLALMNGPKQKTQPHLHCQIIPYPSANGIRELISEKYNVPEYSYPSKEELIELANKIR